MRTLSRTAAIVTCAAALDLAWRQLARQSLFSALTGIPVAPARVLGIALIAALTGAGAALAGDTRAASVSRPTFFVLTLALVAGLYAQLQLGARLQSDGFYYFAYLRSLWFDADVDLTNDYRLLGLDDPQHRFLFTPTPTGHAQSAWSIGPAIAWSPFFAAGDLVARGLRATGRDVAVDGTSFPYRQAICIAGLCYGLLGAWCCWRLARRFFGSMLAAGAAATTIGGSFMLWYLVKEPTMSHAPSMATVAAFVLAWAATRRPQSLDRRPPTAVRDQPPPSGAREEPRPSAREEPALPPAGGRRVEARRWILLGLLAGFMMAIRWQNVLFLLLPGVELLGAARARPREAIRAGVLLAGAVAIGFLPQMLAWLAIYGTPLAQSPVGPRILWSEPQLLDVLWSSRNGLFALSPVLYLAVLGLFLFVRTDRTLALESLAIVALMTWLNASVEDWWGGAGFGGRRFDSLIPLFTLGTAAVFLRTKELIARRPALVTGAVLAGLVIWNLTFLQLAATGAFRIGQPLEFERIAGGQARVLHGWVGHPFSWPVSLLYALRHGVAPWRFDVLRPNQFLGDPSRPYGRIDIGTNDAEMVGEGWYAPEASGPTTFRWASGRAEVLVPLDHAAPLMLQIQAQPFAFSGADVQRMTVTINGRRHGEVTLQDGWQRAELPTPEDVWRPGVNRVVLEFSRATRPADVGAGEDPRALSAAVDYVRVQVRAPQP